MTPIKLLDQIPWMGEIEFDTRRTLEILKSNRVAFLDWDVRKVYISERQLALRVYGRRFKGWVVITMATDQTYTVDFLSSHGRPKHQYKNLSDESILHQVHLRIDVLAPWEKDLMDVVVEIEEDFD